MENLEKVYIPKDLEAKWKQRWEAAHCFQPKHSEKTALSIWMPPPNVTGILHMGHTLNNTIQDVLCRWGRIQGYDVLWIPGVDHAGISTQNKVEKALRKEGLSAKQIGREAFVKRAEAWKEQYGHIIFDQLKALGISCDWSRATYTLDPEYSRGVLTAFVRLYEQGRIYRGKRLVNWCPVYQTALSDEEVIMKETAGKLYTVRYPVVERPGIELQVATTRPETMTGDVAVAVHPEDERYKELVGLHCRCQFSNREIPIIADKAVEKDFGTGALKITPAHDTVDFEVGKRHNLEVINVFNPDGTLNENGGEFASLDRFAAREAMVKALEEKGFLVKTEDYKHAVGYSERSQVPIEPYLSEQWFVRYPQVEAAKQVVEENLIQFWPKRWIKTYLHWLNNIQDWCISRQLWWGHRIPVWYHKEDPKRIHVSVEGPSDPENWEQDPDVLDTWFSSWLWPFCTSGWPNHEKMKLQQFDRFFPSYALVSGPDILFFWIARMIMASLEFVDGRPIKGRVPFKNIYLTGIVRDHIGRKMSKTLGNSPDPLDLIERYGADGVRVGLLSIAVQGQDIRFDEHFLVQGRNFCTKLWNACRFRQMQGIDGTYKEMADFLKALSEKPLSIYDQHLLERLRTTCKKFAQYLEHFEFNCAIKELQRFFKNEFCDWYLELLKLESVRTQSHALVVQDLCLRQVLLMLAPFAPFITEELWEHLHFGEGFIQEADWGLDVLDTFFDKNVNEKAALAIIDELQSVVGDLRALKAENKLSTRKDLNLYVCLNNTFVDVFKHHEDLIQQLCGFQSIQLTDQESVSSKISLTNKWGTFALSFEKTEAEIQSIRKEISILDKHIASAQQKLNSSQFTQHAPEYVIEGVRKFLQENKQKRDTLMKLL